VFPDFPCTGKPQSAVGWKMTRLNPGDIVKVLVNGYSIPCGKQVVLVEFVGQGARVSQWGLGCVTQVAIIPLFALQKVDCLQAEFIWNRIRHKEKMVLRAMKAWEVEEVILKDTDLEETPIRVFLKRRGIVQMGIRAKSLGEALKMAFVLAYFTRFSMQEYWKVKEGILTKLKELHTEVRVA
jgi:hypothetical protein